jgi:hypothetical protein
MGPGCYRATRRRHLRAVLDDRMPFGQVDQGDLVAKGHCLADTHDGAASGVEPGNGHLTRFEVPDGDRDSITFVVHEEPHRARVAHCVSPSPDASTRAAPPPRLDDHQQRRFAIAGLTSFQGC